MKIEVTQEDINEGRAEVDMGAEALCACPVARAINRVAGGYWEVDQTHAWRSCDEDAEDPAYIFLPKGARDFIESFDQKETVQPFAFDLDAEAQP